MPLDVSTLKVAKTTMPTRVGSRSGRDLGPNPFLDLKWPYNLMASYENAEAYELTVSGTMETKPARRGKNKGEPVEVLTGDAYDTNALIRQAADKLGLGATIRTYVGKDPKGKSIPAGKVLVKYMGQKRKAARKPKAVAPVAAPAAPATPPQQ